MRDCFDILITKYYTALSGNITYSSASVPIYDRVPNNATFPYIRFSSYTGVDESNKSNYLQEVTVTIQVVSAFDVDTGGKAQSDNIADQIIDIIRERPLNLLNLAPNFKLISVSLDDTSTFDELTATHLIVYRNIRFRHKVEQLSSLNNVLPLCATPAPTLLTATAVSQTQINLSWTDNSGGVASFSIERSSTYENGFAEIATTTAGTTTYNNTGLTAGGVYFYRVRALNSCYSTYSNIAFDCTQSNGVCADGTVVITDNDTPPTTLYTEVVASGGSATRAINNSNYTLMDSAFNVISTDSILAEGSANIIAPDGTVLLKDTIGGVISTTLIPSGNSEDIIAPNAIAVLKDTDNNVLSTTPIKSNSSENIVAPDATVNVNGNLFDTVASGGTLEVPVEYENGTPVGTITGGIVEIPNPVTCADATAVIKDSVGTILKTEAIPSGASEDIIISDGNCEVFNTALDMVAQGNITAEGYLSLEAPDGIVRVRKSDSVLISSQSVPSGGLVNYNVADSTININSSLFTTVKATETANIPVKNTAADNVGSDNTGVWEVADATIENSDASYSTTVAAEGTKILPDITLTQPNGVGETKKSVINLTCTQINALANVDLISQLTTGQVVAIAEGRMTSMPINPNAHQLHSSVLPASIVTGDWRDQYNNGRLSHPTYTNLSRVYMLSDALNFLSYTPNPFGHLKRFTGRTGSYYDEVSNTWKDKNGGAVASRVLAFPDDIIYDHYTGRAWNHNLAFYSGINFATIVSNAAALTTHGLTWRVPTLLEFSSIAINTMANPSGLSYSAHFNTTTAKIFTHNTATQFQWTANVDPTTTANNYLMRSTTTANLIISEVRTVTTSRGGTVCANFNTSDLTL